MIAGLSTSVKATAIICEGSNVDSRLSYKQSSLLEYFDVLIIQGFFKQNFMINFIHKKINNKK